MQLRCLRSVIIDTSEKSIQHNLKHNLIINKYYNANDGDKCGGGAKEDENTEDNDDDDD